MREPPAFIGLAQKSQNIITTGLAVFFIVPEMEAFETFLDRSHRGAAYAALPFSLPSHEINQCSQFCRFLFTFPLIDVQTWGLS